MIVHILPPATGFPAVTYNTDKVNKNKGELMVVSGFSALKGFEQLRPEDYKHHLAMISGTNKRVARPQFHAVISAEGKSYDKHALTAIGESWLSAMGYEKQPYLIIFHKDTANNHVHLVTTRVDVNGKKISDRFEKIRAVNEMNRILGLDPSLNANADLANALGFDIATEAQFRMILESKGYVVRIDGQQMQLIKYGKVQTTFDRCRVDAQIKQHAVNDQRKKQLKALFHKYAVLYSTSLTKDRNSYSSAFAAYLKSSFGIELIFHASGDKPPYGYSVIDHSGKQVFKGSEIIPLKELLSNASTNQELVQSLQYMPNPERLDYYASILRAALYNYADLNQGLSHQGIVLYNKDGKLNLFDPLERVHMATADLLKPAEFQDLRRAFAEAHNNTALTASKAPGMSTLSLSVDIDDEAIHGRNRRRKKKARTNSR